jgi:hypothetical protein
MLLRYRLTTNIELVRSSLSSLYELLTNVAHMPVDDHVAAHVHTAVEQFNKVLIHSSFAILLSHHFYFVE